MANTTNKKFGVVHTSPSNLITNAASLEEGKLYFAAGDASGAVKQGVYGVVGLTTDGSIVLDGTGTDKTVAMFGTGAIADGNGYGLSQANFTTTEKNKLAGIAANANNYVHPTAGTTTQSLGTTGGGTTVTPGTLTKIATVYDASFDASGHYTGKVPKDISINVAKPATAGVADEAKKTTGTLTIKGSGTSVGTFNGSVAEEVNIKSGNASTLTVTGTADGSITITPVTNTVTSNSSALTTGAQVATYVSTQLGNLSGALLYKGTVANATELNSKTKTSGHVWISSAKNWEYTDVNGVEYAIEVGDMFICNGTGWNIVSSEFDVSTYSNELQWGTDVSIAVVDGVTIKAKLPGNPNSDEKVKANTSTGKFYLIGQDDATNGTTESVYKNASVYVDGSALYSEGKKVLTGYTEQYTGTITSITPGIGLTNGTTDNDITSTGTLNLKVASSSEIGGVKPGVTNGKIYGVQVDASGAMTVNVPWTDNNDNTWRDVYVGGTQRLTTGTNSGSLKFVNGTNITATWNSTNKTIQFDASGLATTTQVEEAIDAAAIYWETL